MVEKAPTPERIDREREIVELRTEGYVWREIAVQVGMSTAGVYKAYNRAMTRVITPAVNEHRELELDRLDILQRTYWQPAVNGNLRAADFVLRVIDKRAKLLGLDAPIKVQAEVVTYDGSDLDAEVERFARLIEAGTLTASTDIATITELTDNSEPLGVEEQTSAEGTTTA
jgi:hypothetical protein